MIDVIKKCLFIILLSYCFPLLVIAQEYCSPDIRLQSIEKTSYQPRGDRCEGIYLQQRHGAAYIFLLSFSSWVLEDNLDALKAIYLSWPDKINGDFKIRSESLRRHFYYRMDTIIPGAKHKYRWDTSIINHKDIKLERDELTLIGNYVYNIGGGRREVYMPIVVASKEQHKKNKEIDLLFSSNMALTDVWWDLEELNDEGEHVGFLVQDKAVDLDSYLTGQPIRIKIQKPKKPGFYKVRISTEIPPEDEGHSPPVKNFIFYNNP